MKAPLPWLEKRKRIRDDIARACSRRTSISAAGFLGRFWEGPAVLSIGDFDTLYIPDAGALDEMLGEIEGATGLPRKVVRGHLARNETFPQFAERLLRSGAYEGEAA